MYLTGQISIICYSLYLTLLGWLTAAWLQNSPSEHYNLPSSLPPPSYHHTLIPPITCWFPRSNSNKNPQLGDDPELPDYKRIDWQQSAPPALFVFLSMFRLGAPGLHLNIRAIKITLTSHGKILKRSGNQRNPDRDATLCPPSPPLPPENDKS